MSLGYSARVLEKYVPRKGRVSKSTPSTGVGVNMYRHSFSVRAQSGRSWEQLFWNNWNNFLTCTCYMDIVIPLRLGFSESNRWITVV